jgi:hypothetical protein
MVTVAVTLLQESVSNVEKRVTEHMPVHRKIATIIVIIITRVLKTKQ